MPLQSLPPPTVTSPNGGESWKSNFTYAIKWKTGSEVSNVKIELLKSGKAYKIITKSTKNDGKHDWKIPSSVKNGSAYKIKITVTNKLTLVDQSNRTFTISTTSKSSGGNNLKVTAPMGDKSGPPAIEVLTQMEQRQCRAFRQDTTT
jgi:hypothetical protein